MSEAERELHELLERARQGDEEAARQLVARFEPHVRRIVRTRLPQRLRTKFDSMDFVQSVWGDVFSRLQSRDVEFNSPQQFANFLAVLTRGKVIDQVRKFVGARKYDISKETPVDAAEEGAELLQGRDPTPSHVVASREEFDALLAQRKELHRQILLLRAQGYTFVEIAQQLGLDERTARRVVQSAQEELKRWRDEAQ